MFSVYWKRPLFMCHPHRAVTLNKKFKQSQKWSVWCYSCATYQHVKFSVLSARWEHQLNFHFVNFEKKAILISSEATTLKQQLIARHHKLLVKPVLSPAVTVWILRSAKKSSWRTSTNNSFFAKHSGFHCKETRQALSSPILWMKSCLSP